MSKVEVIVYFAMGVILMAIVPTDEIPVVWQTMLAMAGALFGIVIWELLNEVWRGDE